MISRNVFALVSLLVISVVVVFGLECYVCENQEDNNEKCVKTIMTCRDYEDVCLTKIKWGSPPYWSQGAKKQYYISKTCSSKSECAATRQRYMPTCTHIWYQDWECSDCCQGDRCNYYIISGSENIKPMYPVLLGVFFMLKHVYPSLSTGQSNINLVTQWRICVLGCLRPLAM